MPGVEVHANVLETSSSDPDRALSARAPEALTILAGACRLADSTRRPFRAFAVVSGAAWPTSPHPRRLPGLALLDAAVSVPSPLRSVLGAADAEFLNESGRSVGSRASSRLVVREIVRSQDARRRCSRAGGA